MDATTTTFRFTAGQIARPASVRMPGSGGRLLGGNRALEERRIR